MQRITTKSLFGLHYSVLNLEGINSLDSSNQLSGFYSYIVINTGILSILHVLFLALKCATHPFL